MTDPTPSTDGVRTSRSGPIIASIALVTALVALGFSVYTWLQARPVEYTPEQQQQAKQTACSAFSTVSTGVATNTHLASPGGDANVAGSLAVAANARVALIGGGQYLLNQIEPAISAELADPLTEFATALQDFGAASLAGALNTDPDQAERLTRIEELNNTLQGLCR